jgi:hypothetical protein
MILHHSGVVHERAGGHFSPAVLTMATAIVIIWWLPHATPVLCAMILKNTHG